jgi:hypothetical protein
MVSTNYSRFVGSPKGATKGRMGKTGARAKTRQSLRRGQSKGTIQHRTGPRQSVAAAGLGALRTCHSISTTSAPDLSQAVRLAWPQASSFNPTPHATRRPWFEATSTERLKSGADTFDLNLPSWARRDFRPAVTFGRDGSFILVVLIGIATWGQIALRSGTYY